MQIIVQQSGNINYDSGDKLLIFISQSKRYETDYFFHIYFTGNFFGKMPAV